jgi:hypothetical protein
LTVKYIFATVLGNIKNYQLIPEYKNKKFTALSIKYSSANEFAYGIISLSPLLFIFPSYYLLHSFDLVSVYHPDKYIFITINTDVLSNIAPWKLYISAITILSAIPSADDIKDFLIGLISPTGFIFMVLCFIIVELLYKHGGI